MGLTDYFRRFSKILIGLLQLFFLLNIQTPVHAQQSTVIFSEDFESGQGNWFADNGLWEIGIPTFGPPSAHAGTNCAGTVLDGTYPPNANTRLISPAITLPNPSGGETIQLKF